MTRRLFSVLLALAIVLGALPAASAARPPSQLRGVLLDAEGLPAVGYQLAMKSSEGDLFIATPTGQDGAFEAAALPAGDYSLVAYAPDGAEFRIVDGNVTLEPGQVLRLELRLVEGPVPPGRNPEALLDAGPGSEGGWLARAWDSGAGGKAGVIVVASALAFGLVSLFDDDDEDTAMDDVSPSTP